MFELKIIKAANSVYRGIVRLGIRSLERRDVKAYERLERETARAQAMRESTLVMKMRASFVEDAANESYGYTVRDVNAALNELQNNLDDSTFKN